jgi:hypothetical protein
VAWVGLITALLKLLGVFNDFLTRQQLIDAGHAEAIAASLAATLENIAKAGRAADAVDHPQSPSDSAYAERVRAKFTRDPRA